MQSITRSCLGKRNKHKSSRQFTDFNVMEYKIFFDVISDSTLQLASKNLPLVQLGDSIKKHIYNYLKMLLIYKNVFHILQSKQYIVTDNAEADMIIQFSFIKPDIKETCENIKQVHASQGSIFCFGNSGYFLF